jgi:RNA polymerase sigma-70 factor (ECF subfamily)
MDRRRQDEFEKVVLPHVRSLLRVARRLAFDSAAAEDLVQETMLSAWRGFHQLRPESNARAWVFRILMNTFRSEGRSEGRRLRGSPAPLPAHGFSAYSAVQTAVEVAQALDELTVEHRGVLLLGVVEGFTCQEMSEILRVPIGTVMSRISRARRALREQLETR